MADPVRCPKCRRNTLCALTELHTNKTTIVIGPDGAVVDVGHDGGPWPVRGVYLECRECGCVVASPGTSMNWSAGDFV